MVDVWLVPDLPCWPKRSVGVALPIITIGVYLLLQKEWSLKYLRRLHLHKRFYYYSYHNYTLVYLVHVRTNGAWTDGLVASL